MSENALKKIRESLMMSKSELARKANMSPVTITRIEQDKRCRMETKRKNFLALEFNLSDENKVFGDDRELSIKDNGGRRSSVDRRQFQYTEYIPEQRSEERRNGLDRRKPRRSE